MGTSEPENPQFPPPSPRRPAETRATMKPQDVGPRARKFQDPRSALEALVCWDELAEADLRELEADPHLAPRLQVLQAAEDWLERGPELATGCPSAEELYDYGGGPGASPLSVQATRRIDEHLFGCSDCEELLGTLADAPPSPLLDTPVPTKLPAPRRRATPALAPILELQPRRRRVQRALLACAAMLVASFALWLLFDGRDAGLRLPAAPLLRGEDELALYYPRGSVLPTGRWMPNGTLALRFELRPVEQAENYRVELSRRGAGAFEPAKNFLELQGATLGELVLPARLEPGSYTWRAFARVHGLERDLGARDFELQADAALEQRLMTAVGLDESARVCERVRILHEAGDWTDARELARTLPPSAERERYLGQLPGR